MHAESAYGSLGLIFDSYFDAYDVIFRSTLDFKFLKCNATAHGDYEMRIWTVYKKEMLDGIRDLRSVCITWILPLFLFPAVVALLSMQSGTTQYTIALQPDTIDPSLVEHLAQDTNLTLHNGADEAQLQSYQIDLLLTGYTKKTIRAVEISFNSAVRRSVEAHEYVKAKITEYTLQRALEDEAEARDFVIVPMPVNDIEEGTSQLILFSVLPVLLMVIGVTSPIAIASDTLAGEKERHSLELLFASAGSRMDILLGKYCAVLTFGTIGIFSFLTGVIISFYINSDLYGISTLAITVPQGIAIAVLVILSCAVISSFEVILSLYARSVKESQLYIIPLSVLTIGLCSFSETLYFSIVQEGYRWIYWVPVLNIIHLLREVVMKEMHPGSFAAVTATSLLLSLLCLCVAGFLSGQEKIVYRN